MSDGRDPYDPRALAAEALQRAMTAERTAERAEVRLEERTGNLKERIEDLAEQTAGFRAEARADHETASRALAHLRKDLEGIIGDQGRALSDRLDAVASSLETVQASVTGEGVDLERRKLSNTRLSILVGAGVTLSGSLTAIVIKLLDHLG
jgi:cytochrome c556